MVHKLLFWICRVLDLARPTDPRRILRVRGCSACNGTHLIAFYPVAGPNEGNYTHEAQCPQTGRRIYAKES